MAKPPAWKHINRCCFSVQQKKSSSSVRLNLYRAALSLRDDVQNLSRSQLINTRAGSRRQLHPLQSTSSQRPSQLPGSQMSFPGASFLSPHMCMLRRVRGAWWFVS
ncbi:uncharacterized protein LOC124688476 [Lolium rigidum]|uniref:uncharacterized protein LOC124688476 n=1 Tax=Lolium rigidum TaxID=89674 RepID=UPI001F5D2DF4|nr:uncharacterized protein LOC124688476 [Lolium rigidum]